MPPSSSSALRRNSGQPPPLFSIHPFSLSLCLSQQEGRTMIQRVGYLKKILSLIYTYISICF
ncbi:hypothetical protein HanIR_Chr03g0103011 [Helianthus annuus]|nr:hypothetical protein HanIR_Chr03g0103011 [Helianthus annuus]